MDLEIIINSEVSEREDKDKYNDYGEIQRKRANELIVTKQTSHTQKTSL